MYSCAVFTLGEGFKKDETGKVLDTLMSAFDDVKHWRVNTGVSLSEKNGHGPRAICLTLFNDDEDQEDDTETLILSLP
jgi:hypothetical protein